MRWRILCSAILCSSCYTPSCAEWRWIAISFFSGDSCLWQNILGFDVVYICYFHFLPARRSAAVVLIGKCLSPSLFYGVIFNRVRITAKSDCYLRRVCPYEHPHGSRIPLNGFSWNLIFEHFFENMSRKFKFQYYMTRTRDTSHEDLCIFITISLQFFLEWETLHTKFVVEIKIHILCSITFFPDSRAILRDNVEKQTCHRRQYNTVHALCMLDN